MDILSTAAYPSSALSNFAAHAFVFDGVPCASMEGLLQSFKFSLHKEQLEVCALTGVSAKRRGQERNAPWKTTQLLWWKGVSFPRESRAYQDLLNHAFDALATNTDFQRALMATQNEPLTHTMGHLNPKETILTEQEFCAQLTRLREALKAHQTKRPRFT
jgi:serine protease inhibitor